MLDILLASLALGLVAGLLAGLFGIGGGLVIVPVLVILLSSQGLPEKTVLLMAVATSLATIILTAISSVIAHHRLGAVKWDYVWRLAPMIVLGSAGGAVIADWISAEALRYVLAGFLSYVAVLMAVESKPKPVEGLEPRVRVVMDSLAGLLIGVVSAIVGIGGGTLTVPYLVRCKLPMRNAVAISSACGLPIALSGTLSYAWLGWNASALPVHSLGYVYWPAWLGIAATSVLTAPVGAKLANQLPAKTLKRYFAWLLLAMVIKLVWR